VTYVCQTKLLAGIEGAGLSSPCRIPTQWTAPMKNRLMAAVIF